FDADAAESFRTRPEGQLLIDSDYPSADTQRIVFPIFYENSREDFQTDRYGHETLIRQQQLVRWRNVPLRDANLSLPYPMQIELEAGEHRFEFELNEQTLLLGSIYVEPFAPLPG